MSTNGDVTLHATVQSIVPLLDSYSIDPDGKSVAHFGTSDKQNRGPKEARDCAGLCCTELHIR